MLFYKIVYFEDWRRLLCSYDQEMHFGGMYFLFLEYDQDAVPKLISLESSVITDYW